MIKAGPGVNHGVVLSGFAAFLLLELKHNLGLDVISPPTRTLSLWSADRKPCS